MQIAIQRRYPQDTRRIWHYDKAYFIAIMESINAFNWYENLNKMTCPDEQVRLLNKVFLNIYSNFIPNEVKTVKPGQAPWIAQAVKKSFLRERIMLIKPS